jgi:hypothetical protein
MGERRPKTVATEGGKDMKRLTLMFAAVAALALMVAMPAFAVTVPAVPVSEYGQSLLTQLASSIAAVLPYAAGITAFAIGVGMLRRWLGHRKATSV